MQALVETSTVPHIERRPAHNGGMRKRDIGQVFADNLKAAIARKKLTQAALAKRSGVSQGLISVISRSEHSPTIDKVAKLAYALDMQPWELLADDDAAREAAWKRMLGKDADK